MSNSPAAVLIKQATRSALCMEHRTNQGDHAERAKQREGTAVDVAHGQLLQMLVDHAKARLPLSASSKRERSASLML